MYIFLLGTVYDHSLPSIDTSAHTWRRYKIHDREATCITPIEHSQIFTLPYIHAYNMFIYMKDRDMCRCKWTHIQSHLNSYTHTHTHTHTHTPSTEGVWNATHLKSVTVTLMFQMVIWRQSCNWKKGNVDKSQKALILKQLIHFILHKRRVSCDLSYTLYPR